MSFKRAALAAALLQAFSLHAQTTDEAAVIVSATRFASGDPRVPSNITVLTREDIRTSAAGGLPDLLRSQAGINVRSLYGQMAKDATVDLRGFGDSAASNTLVLIDGQRLNAIDSGTLNWSSIPLETVDRIEIIRGSGTVLYGDRASGGVINIVTGKSAKPAARAAVTVGGFGNRSADFHAAGGDGGAYYNLGGHYAEARGWRRNSQADQASVAGRAGLRANGGEQFVDFAVYRDSSGMPGAVFRSAYLARSDAARFPLDNQKHDGFRVRPGFAFAVNSRLDVEGELGYTRDDYQTSSFNAAGNPSFLSTREGKTLSATPRARWRHDLGERRSETVFGFDFYDGEIDNPTWSSFGGNNVQHAAQTSRAFYAQNVTGLTADTDLTLGARSQQMHQSGRDAGAAVSDSTTRRRNAWEAGITSQLDDRLRVFARTGRTFRFANTDELFGFDPLTFATVFRGDLKPQHGVTKELGGSWRAGSALLKLSVFHMKLTDEIAYDGNSGANVNLPSTRHKGVEFEAQWRPASNWLTRLAYGYTAAEFTAGADAGKDIPSVPHNKLGLEVRWEGGRAGTWSAAANRVGTQVYSGDTANIRGLHEAYTTLDLRAEWDLKPWKVAARVANATNQRYSSFAGYSVARADYFYYPAEPRTLFVTLGYNFR